MSRSMLRLLLFSFCLTTISPAFGQTPVAPPKAVAAAPVKPLTAAQRKAHIRNLAKKIDELLVDPEVARGFWGINIVSLQSGQTVYEQNADKLFTPASNTKLFTTAAALAMLGPDYRYHTTVESSATIDKHGRLTGDLILVGRGDPNLSGRVLPYFQRTQRTTPPLKLLEDLADQVVAKGLKTVDGDLVGDDTFYSFERFGEGWSQDDLMWEYGAPVSALTLNDNVIFVNVLPSGKIGDKAFVKFDPDSTYYEVNNQITTLAAGSGPRKISMDRQPGSRQLTMWGTIPMDDPGDSEGLAIEDPADFAAQVFRTMLEKRGVTIHGKQRTNHAYLANLPIPVAATTTAPAVGSALTSPVPKGGGAETLLSAVPPRTVLASRDSGPLSDDLRVINKISQNLHAELTLRLLGHEKGTGPTLEAALEVLRNVLTSAGIAPEEYVFFDGSGLSRQDLVSPRAVVKLLRFADSPNTAATWRDAFRSTLPVGGEDGSLADRFKGTPAQDHVWAKTGTLGHVNALSGYAQTSSGEPLAFSIICNNHKLKSKGATKIMDQIVELFVDDVPPKSVKKPKKAAKH
ncbi:MAG: D-Ala-D-Ala carboxypeptidase [Acidobacteriales bacterium]|nr:D-Ala-D-Ala carboxypeptidase [Terriglobales bacterium]